jgi:hypothetical protein
VPLDTTVDIYVNRNQTAKGGLRIDDFQTSAVADTDVAIGASEIIPPTKVIDLAATPVTTSVNLAWTAATDAGGSGLAGYRVYRWETPASGLHYTPAPACIATIAPDATTYIDSTVAYGKQYHYELRAFDSATNVGPRSNAVAVTALTPAMTAVYRFYNVRTGSHFYTASAAERAHVNATWPTIFTDEGVAYTADPWKNTQPLYRFYNVRTQSHFYTASAAERAHVNATWPTTFSDEGVAYNVSTTSGIPVYRFYNVRTGSHFYTASAAERAHVNATWPTIFSDEGVAYYLAQ